MRDADVAIISSVHHPDDGRLVRWRRALEAAGLEVVVDCPTERRHGAARLRQRCARAVGLPFRHRAKVLLVPDPDLAITGLVAARLRRIGIVADVHEDYVRVSFDRDSSRGIVGAVARFGARLAAFTASKADVTVVTDDRHEPLTARDRRVVMNVPAAGELGSAGDPDVHPRAVYVGDVRPSRGLHAMVDAVLDSASWSLDIVGPVRPQDEQWVRDRCGVASERIRLHGRLAPADAWRIAEGAWLGLSLLEDIPPFRVIMPTKVYEYLSIGLPVASTPLPRVVERIGPSDAVALVDPAGAAELLKHWEMDPEEMRRARLAAARWCSENIPDRSPFDDAAERIAALVSGR